MLVDVPTAVALMLLVDHTSGHIFTKCNPKLLYIQYPLIYAIWLAITQITWSPLYEWMKETRGFIYHTRIVKRVTLAVTSSSAVSLNEDIHEQHLQSCPESHFTSILSFNFDKTSVISYTHRTVKVFTETRQNKSSVKLGRHCGRNIVILFSRLNIMILQDHIKIIKTLSF